MILSLWVIFLSIGLILIVLGLFIREHTELSIIGFLFLFLLSFNILNGTLEYKSGTNTTNTLFYSGGNLSSTIEITTYNYNTYSSHTFGYWLAIVSAVGLLTMIFSITKTFGVQK